MNCASCGKLSKFQYCDNLCRYHKLPFRSWDGEGLSSSNTHIYNILGCSDDSPLINSQGISTLEAFDFLTIKRKPAINIWYFFDYDVNMILKDIPLHAKLGTGSLDELARNNTTRWRGWIIKYVPNKIFSIRRGSHHFRSYDVSGFFQKSFIKACESFSLDTSKIIEGKAARGEFQKWKVEDVIAYNQEELKLLVELMTKIRLNLKYHAPTQWYGPGAVASQWLDKKCKIKMEEHRTYPNEMLSAILHAYFGGRVDVSVLGEVYPCYAYDIASAYPYAMARIPLVTEWYFETRPTAIYECNDEYALFKVKWSISNNIKWGPFPWRSSEGQILYPPSGEGWFYGCEMFAAEHAFPNCITRLSVWIPKRNSKTIGIYPLRQYITNAYNMRRRYKSEGNPAELAYKLILNSIYGKTAQKRQNHTQKIPRFQNYIWAGFTTALTRSMILDAIALASNDIVSVATDSIFSRKPILPLTKSGILGEWQYEGNYPTIIVMPGVYARISNEGVEKYRQRGFPIPINYGRILRTWGCSTEYDTPGSETDSIRLTRFATFRNAIARKEREWGYFCVEEKALHDVSILGFGKRYPDPRTIFLENWKERSMLPIPAPSGEIMSHPYVIPTFEEEVEREGLYL